MGFLQDAITTLSEQMLEEDKMVKYDGEISPKFGWCTILMGGAGSGKSFARKRYMAIDSRVIDVDKYKSSDWLKRLNLYDEIKSELEVDDSEMNPTNSDYVKKSHFATQPYTNALKRQGRTMGKYADKERLPNVLFDITGNEFSKISQIIEAVKPLGYKIAIVFVFASITDAMNRNFTRDRVVDRDNFLRTHQGVLNTIQFIFDNEYNKQVDEFWLVDSSDLKGGRDVVYDIKNGIDSFTNALERILYNQQFLDNPPSQTEWDAMKEKIKNSLQ